MPESASIVTGRVFDVFRAKLFAPLRRCGNFLLPPRSENDYATHVPVLIGLAALRRVERVLEFGCGYYSTMTFLNVSAFPHLRQLQSVENNAAWGETVCAAVKHDNRCEVRLVTGEMAEAASAFDLEAFDLILVDDSTSAEQRVATIQAISRRHPKNPWLAIHDFEVDEYRRAASAFAHRLAFKAYNPYTGVVSNAADYPAKKLKQLEQCLKANSSRLEPDDLAGWIRALHK